LLHEEAKRQMRVEEGSLPRCWQEVPEGSKANQGHELQGLLLHEVANVEVQGEEGSLCIDQGLPEGSDCHQGH
jgi:hypothetical protein